jgi:hypothetical protein
MNKVLYSAIFTFERKARKLLRRTKAYQVISAMPPQLMYRRIAMLISETLCPSFVKIRELLHCSSLPKKNVMQLWNVVYLEGLRI